MGHKINPTSLRLPSQKNWQSKWFAGKNYADFLLSDVKIRRTIEQKLTKRAGVARVDIERSASNVNVIIHTSKPGVVIGRGGSGIEELKKALAKVSELPLQVTIEEVRKPDLNALLVAENVANQLERRISFRRAMRVVADNVQKSGAKGFKVAIAGRLGGADMARRESNSFGSIPLSTIKADIDYAQTVARTTYGIIGVKVWIYKGDKE